MICAAEHELVPDVETALRRCAGLLRPAARHQQRAHRAHQWSARKPPRFRPRLAEPQQLHRQMPTRSRRIPIPTTPSISNGPITEPVDPLSGGELGLVDAAPRPGFFDQLGLEEPLTVSACALSKDEPTASADGRNTVRANVRHQPSKRMTRLNRRSNPVRSVRPSRLRVQRACSTAPRNSRVGPSLHSV